MKLLKGFGAILSFLISIVFFFILISFITIIFTKKLVQQETLNKYFETVNIFSLPAEGVLKDKYTGNETVKDIIKIELEKHEIPKELTEQLIEDNKLSELVSNLTSQFSKYILLEGEKPQLKTSDIYEIINKDIIRQYLDRDLTKKEEDNLDEFIISTVNEINNQIPEKEELLETTSYTKILKDTIKLFYSSYFIIIMLTILILLYLMIGLFRWSLYKPLIWTGVPTISVGVLLMLSYIIQLLGINYVVPTKGTIEIFIIKLTEVVFKDILITGIIVTILGILMIIIYSIINKNKIKEIK